MNQIFSFKRYVWLLKRQWYENAAIYKWGIVLMVLTVGLLFWLFSPWKSGSSFPLAQKLTFTSSGILFIFIYAAWFFDSLNAKHKRMFYFSLPVLPLERVAVAFTCVMIILPALFLTVFSMCDFIAVQLFNHIHGVSMQMFFKNMVSAHFSFESSSFEHKSTIITTFFSFLSFASVFTLGSLMFGKRGSVISIAFLISFFVICQWLWTLFSDTLHSAFVIDYIENYIFIYLLPICWTAMYFVMKRKQA